MHSLSVRQRLLPDAYYEAVVSALETRYAPRTLSVHVHSQRPRRESASERQTDFAWCSRRRTCRLKLDWKLEQTVQWEYRYGRH